MSITISLIPKERDKYDLNYYQEKKFKTNPNLRFATFLLPKRVCRKETQSEN